MRKGIETTFSMLKGLFLRKIHAVTFKGFLIKILMFIMAFTFNNWQLELIKFSGESIGYNNEF
jgi:uncharacterized membrane protein